MKDPLLESADAAEASIDPSQELSALRQVRINKCQRLRTSGINPYPATDGILSGRISSVELRKRYDHLSRAQESEDKVRFAGRIMTRRDMGKAGFAHLEDFEGKIQIYVRKDVLGEPGYDSFTKDFDLGDTVGVEGRVFKTKTGELSIRAEKIAMLSKSV